jgi:MYXO-CTERM domain-containing protein
MWIGRLGLQAVLVGLLSPVAQAALADFRVSEVFPGTEADPALRFIELAVPQGTAGNCLFPTTRIEIFDPEGMLIGAVAPFSGTVCYAAGTYFLLATPEAAALFGVERDARLDVAVPREGGQVCLSSSQTRYDCARWGPVAAEGALRYLRNTDDATATPAIPAGAALSRTGDVGIVAEDFVFEEPTPRQPNDGTVWSPPDAGPDGAPPADAAVSDAAAPDAPDLRRFDAPPVARPDANFFDPAFLSADPGGGAACGCRLGGDGPSAWLIALALAGLLLVRRP